MSEETRDFKGVWIPKAVWLDDRLTALDKVILVEIDSLDQTERGCYASNKHIAEFCQCSETKVSQSVAKLVKLNYVYVKSFDGRQRELKSSFTKNAMLPYKKCKADLQNMQESNTDNNTVTKPIKKVRKNNSFDTLIADYAKVIDERNREQVVMLLGEWLKVRKAKRAAMTDYAIQLNLKKIDELAKQSGMDVPQYLEAVIAKGWSAFYAIQNYNNAQKVVTHNDENAGIDKYKDGRFGLVY